MNTSANIANTISVLAIATTAWLLWRKRNAPLDASANAQPSQSATPTVKQTFPNPSAPSVGYRNNNPLNIFYSASNDWKGQIVPSGDLPYAQFYDMSWGYRAAFININTYIRKKGINTVRGIVDRWSGNAANYVNFVCSRTGFSPSTVISPTNKDQMCSLVYAMSQFENGANVTVPEKDLLTGWYLYTEYA